MLRSLIVGGTGGLGSAIARRLAERGDEVIVTGRTVEHAERVADTLGSNARGLRLDLANPASIADGLNSVEVLDNLVLTAISPFPNTLKDFNITEAIAAVTVKLVGYTETVRVLHGRLAREASVVLFGGLAKDRPYPGSTIVTTHNGGISALARTLAVEIAPHRVNALHPGVVGNSPRWRDVAAHPALPRTPIGRLVTMDEVTDATLFLLSNRGVNAQDLIIDGGFSAT